ncbi:hypothetical protein [Flavobacterium daejeonense]|uniref:hypothetical protein n=1 Tax=Flavobacterium daejeonense TaxID=350893 RepID=UPI00047ECF22|nr:hypothetical protein [Flavobacterium daejeonense]
MKRLLLGFILLVGLTVKAQKEVASLAVPYSSDFYSDKESVAVSNAKTKDLVLLIEDNDKTILSLLNEDFKQIGVLEGEKLDRKFKTFIGYSIQSDTYYIFFKNNTDKKFGYIEFNFKSAAVAQFPLDFKLEDEKYVEGITQNDVFYLMTADKKSDNVNFYEFTKQKQLVKHAVDFKSATYESNLNGITVNHTPYKLLTSNSWGNNGSLTKIDLNSPGAIESTSEKVKLYQLGNELIFTFDNQDDKTCIISINTTDFSKKEIVFEKPSLDLVYDSASYNTFSHNSLYNNGVLYQAICSSKELKLTAKNFNDNKLLKQLYISEANDTISFKNGPIIQENTSMWYKDNKRVRELEKTSKFLRKVSNGKLGIIAFVNKNNIKQITIGGYIERKGGGGFGMMPMGGIPMGGIPMGGMMLTASFNPVMTAYNGYSYTKSTRIDCLFDDSFNHLEGEIEKNIFDKIHDEENVIKKYKHLGFRLNLKNIYRHNNKFYLSYLDDSDKKYNIVEFEN